jgi:hypothetical protein
MVCAKRKTKAIKAPTSGGNQDINLLTYYHLREKLTFSPGTDI